MTGWAGEIGRGEEYRRIKALAEVEYSAADVGHIIETETNNFITHAGRRAGARLLEPQALGLHEFRHAGGLLGPIEVGGGKTVLSLLLPGITQARRPVLIIPGALKKHKTPSEIDAYAKLWSFPEPILVSYEALGQKQNRELLFDLAPDFLVLDECFMAKAETAARTKRILSWAKKHPDVPFVALGASAITRSILQVWHLSRQALGDRSPFPITKHVAQQWHLAISSGVKGHERIQPGVIAELSSVSDADIRKVREYDSETDEGIVRARLAVHNKLARTAGTVVYSSGRPPCSINLHAAWPDVSSFAEHFERLRRDGVAIDDFRHDCPMMLWSLARQISMGFEYVWEPRPPQEWVNARRDLASWIRQVLARGAQALDSPSTILDAVYAGRLPEGEYYLSRWLEVEPTFQINAKPVWFSDLMIDWVAAWMRKPAGRNALIWTDLAAFGRRLSAKTGVPYFGSGGVDKQGTPIEEHRGAAILSVSSNHKGRNLQAWNNNLIVSCTPTGEVVEQLIGRTARRGQEADAVDVTMIFACKEHASGYRKILSDARFTQTLGLDQRVLYATSTIQPELLRTLP